MTTNQQPARPAPIRPFTITIPRRPSTTCSAASPARAARPGPGDNWDYGTPVAYLQKMVDRWQQFDWRAQEARINACRTSSPRSTARPSTSPRPLRRARRHPAAARAHLPGLVRRLPRHDRPAHRPGRARRTAPRTRSTWSIPSMPGFGFSTPLVGERLDDGPGRPDLRHADAPARLRLVRHPRQRRRRDGLPRAGLLEPAGLPRRARAAAVLVPLRRPERVRASSGPRTTRRWSSSAGSSRSAGTTR